MIKPLRVEFTAHIYFHVTGTPEFLEVVALWHSSRGSGPSI